MRLKEKSIIIVIENKGPSTLIPRFGPKTRSLLREQLL